MYNNFLDAVKYFRNLRLRDYLDHVSRYTHENDSKGVATFNTWESGFFSAHIEDEAPKLFEALGIVFGDTEETIDARFVFSRVELPYLSRSADKFISHDGAFSIAKIQSEMTGRRMRVDFDFRDPYANITGYEEVFKLLLHEIETRFSAQLLETAKAFYQSEYNPIENYSMTQTETPNITETLHTETNTNLTTDGESHGDVYGFNSTTASHLNAGDNTQTTSGNKDDNFSDSSRSETGTRTLTRSGNIGVTTSQQMLTSELELRRFDFLNEVYRCMDKILVASVY